MGELSGKFIQGSVMVKESKSQRISLVIMPSTGVSGDMMLGALASLCRETGKAHPDLIGIDLTRAMVKCSGDEGITVKFIEKTSGGLDATGVDLAGVHHDAPHLHAASGNEAGDEVVEEEDGGAHHHGMNQADIKRILDEFMAELEVPEQYASLGRKALSLLTEAEARAHGCPLPDVHFHEIGALDTVLDLGGTAHILGLLAGKGEDCILNVEVGTVALGRGNIQTSHGIFPVPAPATACILEGMEVITGPMEGELTTPTGAALVKALQLLFPCELSEPFRLRARGAGTGTREFQGPSILQIMFGETGSPSGELEDGLSVVQTNIDDMTGEDLGFTVHTISKIDGVLDVSIISTLTKKNRPGHKVEILCRTALVPTISQFILKNTTTLGIRYHAVHRIESLRESGVVKIAIKGVEYEVAFKKGLLHGKIPKPEHDDVVRIASASGATIAQIRELFTWALISDFQ